MAHASILSLRHQHPAARVRLVMDTETEALLTRAYPALREIGADLLSIAADAGDPPANSRWLKTQLRDIVRGDFIFLDIDTVVLRDISAVAAHEATLAGAMDDNSMDGFDPGLCRRFEQLRWDPPRQPYLNSGVLFWRDTPEGRRLGQAWHQLWSESRQVMGDTDQPALHRAMVQTGVSVHVLDQTLNQKVRNGKKRLRNTAVLHYTTRSVLDNSYVLLHRMMRQLKERGSLDFGTLERARRRNDPWVEPVPGILGNINSGRYGAALRVGFRRLTRRGRRLVQGALSGS